jgi:hypothetical protein
MAVNYCGINFITLVPGGSHTKVDSNIWPTEAMFLESWVMDKLKLTGQNLGRVFNSRLVRACIGYGNVHITKQPNLKLKTWPKRLLGSLPLAFMLTG